MIKIIEDISASDLEELRNSVGWKKINSNQLEKGLKNTKYKVKVLYDNKLAACGRIVSDGYSMGVLNNIIVKPEFQGKGLGKTIVTSLFNMVNNDLEVGDRFQIEATPTSGNREFYVKCGMKYKPDFQDGTYLWIEKGIHKMNLEDFAFNAIKSGKKTIEIRLLDEKRQTIKEGEYIEFTNRKDNSKLLTKVEKLYIFDSFEELFNNFDKKSLGLEEKDTYEIVNKFYSEEEQKKYKALGIKISIV